MVYFTAVGISAGREPSTLISEVDTGQKNRRQKGSAATENIPEQDSQSRQILFEPAQSCDKFYLLLTGGRSYRYLQDITEYPISRP